MENVEAIADCLQPLVLNTAVFNTMFETGRKL